MRSLSTSTNSGMQKLGGSRGEIAISSSCLDELGVHRSADSTQSQGSIDHYVKLTSAEVERVRTAGRMPGRGPNTRSFRHFSMLRSHYLIYCHLARNFVHGGWSCKTRPINVSFMAKGTVVTDMSERCLFEQHLSSLYYCTKILMLLVWLRYSYIALALALALSSWRLWGRGQPLQV